MGGSERATSVAGRQRGWSALPAVVTVLMAVSAVLLAFSPSSSAAIPPTTPYMGWNTYYGLGGRFNESTVESVAASLISSGLARAGYRIVWLDFGWASGARNVNGELVVDHNQWPHGLTGLTAWLHQQGLEAGIYTDAGSTRLQRPGSRVVRPLPAGRQRVRGVGLRRRQGRLLRRRPARPRPARPIPAVRGRAGRQFEPPPDAAQRVQLLDTRTDRRDEPVRGQLVL